MHINPLLYQIKSLSDSHLSRQMTGNAPYPMGNIFPAAGNTVCQLFDRFFLRFLKIRRDPSLIEETMTEIMGSESITNSQNTQQTIKSLNRTTKAARDAEAIEQSYLQ